MVGGAVMNDYLPLYDLSQQLGKHHALKVEIPRKDQAIIIDGQQYIDMGTRDIIHRLALSPVGKYKIVFLENIERMTISAANAFLKTFEEPLPNRIIIATTSNRDTLLDTIISRAFLIPFQIPAADMVIEHLASRYPEKTDTQRLFAASFSLGRIGLAKSLLDTSEDLEETSVLFIELLHLLHSTSQSVVRTHQLLQQFKTLMGVEQLLDALLYAGVQADMYGVLSPLMRARHMLQTNVKTDNILFDIALQQ